MENIYTISEEQCMHMKALISSIPRKTLDEFKQSISILKPEELKYLKQELSILVSKGKSEYIAFYDSL